MKNNNEYKKVKTELSKKVKNTRYFNQAFYNTFVSAMEARKSNIKNGIDDSYIKDGYIILYHCFDPVYESNFYNLNSGAYCEFLSIIL